jgi:hypothetical protein
MSMPSIKTYAVIPTKVGIHLSAIAKAGPWIPTFVGMTIQKCSEILGIEKR